MIIPIKKPIDEKKLVFKNEQYIKALYCILQVMGTAVIKASAFKALPNCKDKILVEYNEDKNCYRLRLRKEIKRGIIKPNRKIITGISKMKVDLTKNITLLDLAQQQDSEISHKIIGCEKERKKQEKKYKIGLSHIRDPE